MKKFYILALSFATSFGSLYSQALQHNYSKSIGTIGSAETVNKIITDASGNTYAVGAFAGTVDFDPGTGTANLTANVGPGASGNDAFVAKYDVNGNYVWAFKIGTGINFEDVARDITIDELSNTIYVTGNFSGFNVDFDPSTSSSTLSGGAQGVFVAHYTTSGVYQNAIQILGNVNGFGIKYFNNAVFITGENTGTTNFNPGGTTNLVSNGSSPDIYVACYNSSLNLFWAHDIGGSFADGGAAVDVDGAGNCYVTGKFTDVVDFDPSGLTASMISNGGSDGFVARYSPSGTYQWVQTFGTSAADGGKKIIVNGSDAYVSGFYGGTNQAYFCKRDASNFGTLLYQKTLTGTADVFVSDLGLDASGNVYVTGHFNGANQSFDGIGTITFPNRGGYDCYIAKYNSGGGYLYAFTFGGPNNDYTSSLNVNPNNNVYVTGIYYGSANFSSSPTFTNNLTSVDAYDMFLAKYNPCTLPSAPVTSNAVLCYPTNLSFTASGSGTISWHATSTGTVIATGTTYTTANTFPSNAVSTTTIYAQNSNACGASTKSAIIYTINPKPSISAVTGVTTVCAGQNVDIYTYGANTYTLANNGQTIGANTFFSFTPTTTTTFSISGTNSYGCTNNTTFIQNVSTCTGVDEGTMNDLFSIFPNPALDLISIAVPNTSESIITVINALGEVVSKEEIYAKSITLKIDTLTNGVYFIKLDNEKGSSNLKFIKQ